jgi:putative flippase GtrA
MNERGFLLFKRAWSIGVLRFLLAGMLNTIVGYSIFAALIYIHFSEYLSLLFSTILGVIFNYLNFGKTVFYANRDWLGFTRFIAIYFFIYVLNVGLLGFLTHACNFDAYIGQIICLPVNVLVSWFLLNKWVFKRDLSCQKE